MLGVGVLVRQLVDRRTRDEYEERDVLEATLSRVVRDFHVY